MTKEQHDQEAAINRPIKHNKIWFQQAAKLLKQAQVCRCKTLDIACGNAEFSEIMRDQFKMEVTCVDYVDSYVESARAKGFETYKLNLEQDNLSNNVLLSKHKGAFDLVVMLEAIEHIFDTDELLKFVHTLLKPGGSVLISTPNISFIGYRLYSLVNGNVPYSEGHHVRFFDEKRLNAFLFLTGFDSANAQNANYVKFIPFGRICTQRSHIPMFFGKALAYLLAQTPVRYLLPRGLRHAGLVVLAKREDVEPLSLSWRRSKQMLEQVDEMRRRVLIKRLKLGQQLGFMHEHPGLNAFVESLELSD